jgi:hypothetical protein
MRDYAKVCPGFWTGETGRHLRQYGRDAQLVALYLITGPSANMIGLYILALPLLEHHTGLSRQGALEALRSLSEGGFCQYDEAAEEVWVPEMACYQVGPTLKKEDNQVKGVTRELQQFRKSRFFKEFLDRYGEAYHLNDHPDLKPLRSPSEGPCKPLRSQEQEQEQDLFAAGKPPHAKGKALRKKAAPAPRPRNPIFDAIAEATGLDPKTAGSSIGQAAATIEAAGYTAEDVRRFVEEAPRRFPWVKGNLTQSFIAQKIGVVRTPLPGEGAAAQTEEEYNAQLKADRQAEEGARALARTRGPISIKAARPLSGKEAG